MEQLQQLLCIYFGIEILLCIYTLFKYTNCKNNVKKQRLVGRASRKFVFFIQTQSVGKLINISLMNSE